MHQQSTKLLQQTIQHIGLTFISLLIAVLIGLPLGIYIARNKKAAGIILGAAGVLQTIPSIALLGFLIPLLGIGPIPATRKALARAGLSAADLDVIEINEAFSSQALACIRDLGLDPAKINLDGGGLSIGHPLGATGARITGKAASLLAREKGRYALATQCIGGGQGIATILERV